MSKKCCHSKNCVYEIDARDFDSAAEFFRMLGDETRIKIFWILCHSEECVLGLSEMLGISSPAISHHLRVLRECALIDSRRDGKEVYYKIADSAVSIAMHSAVESIMNVACPADSPNVTSTDTVRKIHDYLVDHLDERITIDELARMFHTNATTLKEAFKSEYGTSLAAHIKEHRMERAELLLRDTEMNISEIAKNVGFDSGSRFTSAFKEKFGMLPSEYRRKSK